jgi:serine protease Do
MTVWKSVVAGATIALAAGGAVFAPHVQAQDRDRVTRVQTFGRNGQLGVTVHDPSDADSKQPGVVVDEVRRDSPAEKAGIKAGDVIQEFDGERIRSARQFARVVQETAPDRPVPVVLTRNGQRTTVHAIVAASGDFGFRLLEGPEILRIPEPPMPPMPPAMHGELPFDFETFLGRGRRLGITIEDLNSQLGDYFGVKQGVLVKSVTEGSAAAKAGLKAGDVITGVNGAKVTDARDVTRAIDRLDAGGDFTLEIVRDRKTQTLKGKVESRSTRVRTIV